MQRFSLGWNFSQVDVNTDFFITAKIAVSDKKINIAEVSIVHQAEQLLQFFSMINPLIDTTVNKSVNENVRNSVVTALWASLAPIVSVLQGRGRGWDMEEGITVLEWIVASGLCTSEGFWQ